MAFDAVTHPKKLAFLHAYSLTGSIKFSADAAKVQRATHYDWLAADEAYSAAFKRAEAMAADALVDEAKRRAHKGTKEYILYKGEIVTREVVDADGVVTCVPLMRTRFSDSLLLEMIRGLKPDVFHERREIAHSAPEGLKLEVEVKHALDLSALTDEELAALERIAGKVNGSPPSGGGGTPPKDGTGD